MGKWHISCGCAATLWCLGYGPVTSGSVRLCFQASVPQCAICMFDESLFASDYHAFDACEPVDYCITQSTKSNILSLLRIWINTFCKPIFGYLHVHVFCLYSCGGIEGVSFYVSIVFVCVCVICELLASVNCACTEKDFFLSKSVFCSCYLFPYTVY